jgi:hypothetical protein
LFALPQTELDQLMKTLNKLVDHIEDVVKTRKT